MENRLKQFREEKGWTQDELAQRSGVSRVTICLLENGKMKTSKTDTLTKIADALGAKVTSVFFYQEGLTC